MHERSGKPHKGLMSQSPTQTLKMKNSSNKLVLVSAALVTDKATESYWDLSGI